MMTRLRPLLLLPLVFSVPHAAAQAPTPTLAATPAATTPVPPPTTPTPPAATPRYPDALAYKPSALPDRVILTWVGDPATSQAVTWRTDTTVTEPVAQIALSDVGPSFDPISSRTPPPGKVTTVAADTQPLHTHLSAAHCHSANFTNLKPKTKYVYRVGDGVNWTEWYQFETASAEPEPFGFIYFGDAQNDLKRHWSRVIRGAYSSMPKAKFLIHAGDLVDSGSNDVQWGEWHGAGGWINAMVPCVPTPGNHEYTGGYAGPRLEAVTGTAAFSQERRSGGVTAHWRPQFALPTNGPAGLEETAYYFDYQGVRIVSLNSNEKIAQQAEWLDTILSNNPCKWTVLTFHHPIYSPANGRDNATLRNTWRPIFDKYGVDLVLTGHDHTYGRSGVMRENNELSGERQVSERGTVYVVSVSGPKLYSLDKSATWMKNKAEYHQLYQLINIDGDKLHYESRTARGDLYDEFELRKSGTGGNRIVERTELEVERAGQPDARPSRQQLLYATAVLVLLPLLYAAVRMARRMTA